MSYIKFYDNGSSIEIGNPDNDKSILSFESKIDIDDKSIVSIDISKNEVKELILFLQGKIKDMV